MDGFEWISPIDYGVVRFLVGEAAVQLACLSKATLRPTALPDSLVRSIQTC